jgi:hypothetical protein
MELIKLVRVIGSFVLALFIIAIPFTCALSYALNWNILIKGALTIITIGYIIIKTMYIYYDSEE